MGGVTPTTEERGKEEEEFQRERANCTTKKNRINLPRRVVG